MSTLGYNLGPASSALRILGEQQEAAGAAPIGCKILDNEKS